MTQRQDVPHSRADVEVLPDVEEVQERMGMAMHLVDACSGVSEAPLSTIMQATEAAATAAASASTLVTLVGAGTSFSTCKCFRVKYFIASGCAA